MTISEAVHIIRNIFPVHPDHNVRYASYVINIALSQDLERPWHACKYEDYKLIHDETFVDGRWYEWLDKYNNREVARMKLDAFDHFFPNTKTIKEEDVIAFRETRYNTLKDKGEVIDPVLIDVHM